MIAPTPNGIYERFEFMAEALGLGSDDPRREEFRDFFYGGAVAVLEMMELPDFDKELARFVEQAKG